MITTSDQLKNGWRAEREVKALGKTLMDDPIIEQAKQIAVSAGKSESEKMLMRTADWNDPRRNSREVRDKMQSALQSAQQQGIRQRAQAWDIQQRQDAVLAPQKMRFIEHRLAAMEQALQRIPKGDVPAGVVQGQAAGIEAKLNGLTGESDTAVTAITTTVTPITDTLKITAKYAGDWAVNYGNVIMLPASPTYMQTAYHQDLVVTKGYFSFGIYRSIETANYTITADATLDGECVIVARGYSNTLKLPTVHAMSLANYALGAYRYGYDGLAGQAIIARATVAVSGGTYYWTSLVQCQYGEIAVDRYDPRFTLGSGDGKCAQVSLTGIGYASVLVDYQLVKFHMAGGGTWGYTLQQSNNQLTVAWADLPSQVYLRIELDGSGGIAAAGVTLWRISTGSTVNDTDTYRYIPLWEFTAGTDGLPQAVGHFHHGIVNIWGDTVFQ